jgi:DNA-directed RNA polymerase specialized sigma24 family protein
MPLKQPLKPGVEKEKMEMFLDAYDKYSEAIYLHCFFRVFSRERAEELEQETFMKTWQYLLDGKEIKTIRPWGYRGSNKIIVVGWGN